MNPVVSIIVPVFRTEAFLRECLASALSQGGSEVEVVVVDDCSPDGASDIAKGMAATDPRVVVLRNDVNRGLLASRVTGMRAARGTWFVQLDGDDRLPAGALARLLERQRETGADYVHGSMTVFGEHGEPLPELNELWARELRLPESLANDRKSIAALALETGRPWSSCARLVARDLYRPVWDELEQAATDDGIHDAEDILQTVLLATTCRTYASTPAYAYEYRQFPERRGTRSGVLSRGLVLRRIRRWLDAHPAVPPSTSMRLRQRVVTGALSRMFGIEDGSGPADWVPSFRVAFGADGPPERGVAIATLAHLRPEILLAGPETTLGEARRALFAEPALALLLRGGDGRLLGSLSLSFLARPRDGEETTPAVGQSDGAALPGTVDSMEALRFMLRRRRLFMPVVQPGTMKLLGAVWLDDLILRHGAPS